MAAIAIRDLHPQNVLALMYTFVALNTDLQLQMRILQRQFTFCSVKKGGYFVVAKFSLSLKDYLPLL